jgi:hypothetical protein
VVTQKQLLKHYTGPAALVAASHAAKRLRLWKAPLPSSKADRDPRVVIRFRSL